MAEEGIQILEVELGSAANWLEIDFISGVFDNEGLMALLNALEHIEGTINLRGRTTPIVNPHRVFEFDEEARIDPCSRGELPTDDEATRGIVQRNRNFIPWLEPDPIYG